MPSELIEPGPDRPLSSAWLRELLTQSSGAPETLPGRLLDQLGLTLDCAAEDRALLPTRGAAIVVCNCPFGGVEPVLLAQLLGSVRSDVRLVLDRDSVAGDLSAAHVIRLDQPPARATLQQLRDELQRGACLVFFPTGPDAAPSSSATRPAPWSNLAARLALRHRVDLVPVFLGQRASDEPIVARIGRAIVPKRVRHLDRDALTSYAQLRTVLLGRRVDAPPPPPPILQNPEPIATAEPLAALEAEIAALPDENCVMESGSTRVYYAEAAAIPHLLREIGRLREVTFRAVGEGTGKASDIDQYDAYYEHLFSWDHEARRMVGAYRLGRSDVIIERHGLDGLYTQSLFQLDPKLFAQLGPALEMGRSFIVAEHQKDFGALYALWCGIGRFIVRHPRYQRLFGAVSISNEYASVTRQLLMEFLRINELAADLAQHVTPRNPPNFRPVPRDTQELLSTGVQRIEDVEELIRDLESDRRGVPILLRQYLRLNGSLLAFNIDPDFGDVLDGLMLIDVTQIEPKMFRRFLGLPSAAHLLQLARDAS